MAVFNQQFNSSLLPSTFAHVIAEFVIVTSLILCRHSFNFRPLMWDLWWTKWQHNRFNYIEQIRIVLWKKSVAWPNVYKCIISLHIHFARRHIPLHYIFTRVCTDRVTDQIREKTCTMSGKNYVITEAHREFKKHTAQNFIP
jgi:hypothetical protein